MRRNNIIIVFLMTGVFVSLFWLVRIDRHDHSNPKAVFDVYINALKKDDVKTIFSLLLDEDKALFGADKESQVQGIKHAIGSYSYKNADAEIVEVQQESETKVTVVYNMLVDGDLLTEKSRFPMIKINGKWKFDSSGKRWDQSTKNHLEELLLKRPRMTNDKEIFEKQKKDYEEWAKKRVKNRTFPKVPPLVDADNKI